MKNIKNFLQHRIETSKADLKVGFFLALRETQRSSKWTTTLIIFIMTITFLNLVVVRGILVGLIEGSKIANKTHYSSDIILSTPQDKSRIENSAQLISAINNIQHIKQHSSRYTTTARLEAGYTEKIKLNDKPESVGTTIAGINFADEDAVTQLSQTLTEGEYIYDDEPDVILVGANLLAKYQSAASIGSSTIRSAGVGSKVRLTVNNNTREVIIKGVVKAKVTQVDQKIYINQKQLRQMMGRSDFDVNEIAINLQPNQSADLVKNILIGNDADKTALVQTAEEGQPQFVKDIEGTFNILGNVIGSIALAVATISIFIVIFVNAITRRKYIGILKGIGVTQEAIELSYMMQSLFYATCGICVAMLIIFGILKPYFTNNPINFPFSDGILVASLADVTSRGLLLICATVIAGYIPSHIVVKQHTLDAILGR